LGGLIGSMASAWARACVHFAFLAHINAVDVRELALPNLPPVTGGVPPLIPNAPLALTNNLSAAAASAASAASSLLNATLPPQPGLREHCLPGTFVPCPATPCPDGLAPRPLGADCCSCGLEPAEGGEGEPEAEKAAEEEKEKEEKEMEEKYEEALKETYECAENGTVVMNPMEKNEPLHCIMMKKAHMKESVTGAVMLLGMVAFVLALFYLVNCQDTDIRKYTWMIISSTISIFCAVLFYQSVCRIIIQCFLRAHIINSGQEDIVNFIMFFLLWLILEALLHAVSHKPRTLKAVGSIGGHVVAFSAIFSFGDWQLTSDWFNGTWWQSLLVPLFYGLLCAVLCIGSHKVRVRMTQTRGFAMHLGQSTEEDAEQWEDECIDAENDFVGLGLGFFATVALRFLVTGQRPPKIMGEPKDTKDKMSTFYLALFGLFSAVFTVLASLYHSKVRRLKEQGKTGPLSLRFATVLQGFFAMTMAWCFLFAGEWAFVMIFHVRSPLMSKVYLAVVLSTVAVMAIFVIDCLMDDRVGLHPRSLRQLVVAFGLMIGFSWEQSFDYAVESLGESQRWLTMFGGNQLLMTTVVAFVLIGVALPAWRMYIIDKVILTPVDEGSDAEISEGEEGQVLSRDRGEA
jgi:hypothetical protein